MSTTARVPSERHVGSPVASYRVVFDVIERWLALLGVLLCALQFSFAALGFWGAEEKPGDQAHGMAAFAPHAVNGQILGYLAILTLIAGIVSRANVAAWLIPLVLAVLLMLVQGLLVGLGFEVSKWYGFLHALDGAIISAGFVWLMIDRFRHPLRTRATTA